MTTLWIGGAGGAPSNNVIRSLRESGRERIIGTSSNPTDLLLADVDHRIVVPPALSPEYPQRLLDLLAEVRPDFLHVQNDEEVLAVSRVRDQICQLGITICLPSTEAVETFVDKWEAYRRWVAAGVPVPHTVLIESEKDLYDAFGQLGSHLWLRATRGGGGYGALPTNDPQLAERWIHRYEGWGRFTAAEMLSDRSLTWQSLWYEGQLMAAQSRQRLRWEFGNRTLSGVTGVTGVGQTISVPGLAELATSAIRAVEASPHGLYGVDMTYDTEGQIKVTEINVGRFFTTIYFFSKAGLNLPRLYVDLALKTMPRLPKPILDPLEPGLLWIRGMDTEPVLARSEELEALAHD